MPTLVIEIDSIDRLYVAYDFPTDEARQNMTWHLGKISWVKVKGHSEEEGNDHADKLAGYAQNGGAKNVQDIAMMIDLLKSDG